MRAEGPPGQRAHGGEEEHLRERRLEVGDEQHSCESVNVRGEGRGDRDQRRARVVEVRKEFPDALSPDNILAMIRGEKPWPE